MTGGLIQIASPGAQDIFLTSDPELSFFKQTWRKYTNFSIEPHTQPFLNKLDFGSEATVVLDKYGDLLYRTYLVIDLPGFDLHQPQVSRTIDPLLLAYLQENDRVIQSIYPLSDIDLIMNVVRDRSLIEARQRLTCDIGLVDIQLLATYWVNKLARVPEKIVPRLRQLMDKEIPTAILQLLGHVNDTTKKNAWIKEIGHQIIDFYEIRVGDTILDKQTGDWLSMRSHLMISSNARKGYDVLIGNTPEMNDPSSQKDPYRLYIPLQLWFTEHTNHTLPISALKQDITITVRLRDLDKLIDIDGLEIQDAYLLTEHIFLDTIERDRFIRHRYDYLTPIVQCEEINDIVNPEHVAVVPFDHPTKYITWKYEYEDGTFPEIESITLAINNQALSDGDQDSIVYSAMASLVFSNSAAPGQYVHSFCLNPSDNQPSGSINLSRIDQFSIKTVFKNLRGPVRMVILAQSYNILRVAAGFIGFAYGRV